MFVPTATLEVDSVPEASVLWPEVSRIQEWSKPRYWQSCRLPYYLLCIRILAINGIDQSIDQPFVQRFGAMIAIDLLIDQSV
jgi:hypothetical protein